MGDFETIRYAVDHGVATITLARPDKRNAVNQTMFNELGDAMEVAASDGSVRAVVVAADGPSFCAGVDPHSLASWPDWLRGHPMTREDSMPSFARPSDR